MTNHQHVWRMLGCLLVFACLAHPGAAQPLMQGLAQELEPESIEVLAVYARQAPQPAMLEDDALKPFRPLLDKLAPNNAFDVVQHIEKQIPYGQEVEYPIDSNYALFLLPMEKRDGDLLSLVARVQLLPAPGTVNALRAHGEVSPGRALTFRGLDGPDGSELVIFMRLTPPDGQQGGGGGQDQESQPQEAQEQDGQQGQEEENEEQDKPEPVDAAQEEQQMAEKQQEEGKEETGEAQEPQNIAALLESLEQEDQRQQAQIRYDNRRKIVSKEWW